MRFVRLFLALTFLIVARPALAQTIVGQDSTLTGLKRVFVKFDVADGSLDPKTAADLESAVTLELRKAGIRVAKTTDELDLSQDGVMLVQFAKIGRSLTNDAVFRIDIRQPARLNRTGRTSFMVTWFYEDNGRNIVVSDFAAAAAKKGTNDFISRWLDMNGR